MAGRPYEGCVESGAPRIGVKGEAKKVGEVIGVPENFSGSWVYYVWCAVPRCVCASAKFCQVDFSNIARTINPDPDVTLCSGLSFETQTSGNLRGFTAPLAASFLLVSTGG